MQESFVLTDDDYNSNLHNLGIKEALHAYLESRFKEAQISHSDIPFAGKMHKCVGMFWVLFPVMQLRKFCATATLLAKINDENSPFIGIIITPKHHVINCEYTLKCVHLGLVHRTVAQRCSICT